MLKAVTKTKTYDVEVVGKDYFLVFGKTKIKEKTRVIKGIRGIEIINSVNAGKIKYSGNAKKALIRLVECES